MTPCPVVLLLSLLLCSVLSACGNKGDLLMPSQVPPDDAGRYLIRPKPAEQPPAPESPATSPSPEPAGDGDDP